MKGPILVSVLAAVGLVLSGCQGSQPTRASQTRRTDVPQGFRAGQPAATNASGLSLGGLILRQRYSTKVPFGGPLTSDPDLNPEQTAEEWQTISNRISIVISDEGLTDLDNGVTGVWHNVFVRITNDSDRALYLLSLKQVSDYTRRRNAQAMCYRIESLDGSWQNAWCGLEELAVAGRVLSQHVPFPAGAVIEFRAPVPIDAPQTHSKLIRLSTLIYLDAKRPGMVFHSNDIKVPK